VKGILADPDVEMFQSYAEFWNEVIKGIKFDPELVEPEA